MAAAKHWLMHTPKELLDNINLQHDKEFVLLKINIYLFQGDRVLLTRDRGVRAVGEEEDWTVPQDTLRIDRPAGHPSQIAATNTNIRNRVLVKLLELSFPVTIRREIQFMEFGKKSPLLLPDGQELTIWCILTACNQSIGDMTRSALLTELNNQYRYRWATEAELAEIKTPGLHNYSVEQLHPLDLSNAFYRLQLCSKAAIIHESFDNPDLPRVATQILISIIELRATCFQDNIGRHGLFMLSTSQPFHLSILAMRADEMGSSVNWPQTMKTQNGEVYRAVGAFSIVAVKFFKAVPWAELMMENGRLNVIYALQ